jgi:urease accessory protein
MTTPTATTDRALLALLQLSSPSLPIGAFAYSQGLEAAIDAGWVRDPSSLQHWLTTVCRYGLTHLDIPLLQRLHQSWMAADLDAVEHWQQFLLASRETRELVEEELQIGGTFRRMLQQLGELPAQLPAQTTYLSMYALAVHQRGIPLPQALLGWLWSWLENQVTVACKTIPLGQTQAQKVLAALLPVLEQTAAAGLQVGDDDLGITLPALVMASAWHEHQYSRLFRS